MSWQTKLFASRQDWALAGWPVGGVYPAPWLLDPTHANHAYLSPRYRDGSGGMPHFIALPGGGTWSPWCVSTGDGPGWEVSGSPERLTATPSINAVGSYHGWLRDGVLSDDCEGRTFPVRP